MRFLKFTRYSEWWEYKLVPLLMVGYATIYLYGYSFDKLITRLLILLLAIAVGAVYVSVINDLTDRREDTEAGKKNRMADMTQWQIALIIGICLMMGLFFGYLIYPDKLSLFFYIMAYVSFSLYSIPPIRLKKRGGWGVICDASGAHLFPTLLIVCNLTYISRSTPNTIWIIIMGIWSLFYGIRGILWHQFHDRENDIASGTTTFASSIDPENFHYQEVLFFLIEVCAFLILLFYIFNIEILLSLFFYSILILIRKNSFHYKSTFIISPKSSPYQLLMNDYYLVFFPLTLLLTNLNQKYGWIVLCSHILLFPQNTILVAKDYMIFIKSKL